jgi:hypothetical protein
LAAVVFEAAVFAAVVFATVVRAVLAVVGRFGADPLASWPVTPPDVSAGAADASLFAVSAARFAVVALLVARGARAARGAEAFTAATLAADSFASSAAASAFAAPAFSAADFAAAVRAALVLAAVRLAAAARAAEAWLSAFTRAVCAAVARGLADAGRRAFVGGEESLGARGSLGAPVMPFTVATDEPANPPDDPK